jgi:hypothetical protein
MWFAWEVATGKNTDTHSQYYKFTAIARQEGLGEPALVLHYTNTACLYSL